jgi:hypothetical protein
MSTDAVTPLRHDQASSGNNSLRLCVWFQVGFVS